MFEGRKDREAALKELLELYESGKFTFRTPEEKTKYPFRTPEEKTKVIKAFLKGFLWYYKKSRRVGRERKSSDPELNSAEVTAQFGEVVAHLEWILKIRQSGEKSIIKEAALLGQDLGRFMGIIHFWLIPNPIDPRTAPQILEKIKEIVQLMNAMGHKIHHKFIYNRVVQLARHYSSQLDEDKKRLVLQIAGYFK